MFTRLAEKLIIRLKEYFDPERLAPLLAEIIIDIVIAVFFLTIFYFIWLAINRLVFTRWKNHFDRTSAAFVETLIKFSILSIGVLAALSAAGNQTATVIASLGVVGLIRLH